MRTRGSRKVRGLPNLVTQTRGSRECRVLAAPAVSCAMCREMRTRAYRYSRSTPAFPAQWFDGLCRALPGDEFVFLHRCRLDGGSIRLDQIRHRQLDISHGCQNHTVLPYAAAPVILHAVP